MAIIKNLEVRILSNQQLCTEYEYPSDEGSFLTTATKYVQSITGARLGIELNTDPSFNVSGFDALLYDIHLDGQLVHSGLLRKANERVTIRDITKEVDRTWITGFFFYADMKAQASQAQKNPLPTSANSISSPTTIESHPDTIVDPAPTRSKPKMSNPWEAITDSNRKSIRFLAPSPGTIQIQFYRVRNYKEGVATTHHKTARADTLANRSAAEYAQRAEALQQLPPPLSLPQDFINDRSLTHVMKFRAARNAITAPNVASIDKMYLDPMDQPWASFVFHYRSRKVLEAWDVRLPREIQVPWCQRVLSGVSVFDAEGRVG